MTQVGQVSVGLGLDDAKFNKDLKKAEKNVLGFAKAMKNALGAVFLGFTVKEIVNSISASVEAFRQQEIAVKQLNNALANSGQYTEEYSRHLQDLASSLQKVTNYGDEATIKAISLGQSFAGNVKITDELIRATLDFAAATGTDLDSAFTLVGKSIGSNINAFKRYGIELDNGISKEQKVIALQTQLANKFNGSAQSMANSTIQLKNAFGDLSESIGKAFNPAVDGAQKYLINFVNGLKSAVDWLVQLRTKYYEFKRDTAERFADVSLLDKQRQFYKDEAKHYQDLIDKSKAIANIENKNNAGITTTAAKEKQQQDERLESYRSFIEEFKQATNEYNAMLEARKKAELMGVNPLSNDYDTLLATLKEYELKVTEIKQSGAYNRNELLKNAEIQLQQELQRIQLEKADETEKQLWAKRSEILDAQLQMQDAEEAYRASGGFLASFGAGFDERLRIEKEYYAKRRELWNVEAVTEEQQLAKMQAFQELQAYRTQQLAQLETDTWRKRGEDIVSIFDGTLTEMLTNYGSFSDNMKQLVLNLTNYIIKQALEEMMKVVTFEKLKQGAIMATGAIKKAFGGIAGWFLHSGGTILPTSKHHYGGMEAPDQTEHFALLKNNERVLSPSETSAYNRNESQESANYIVYAPQVKAMDSKDVAQWFNENKLQVISIVSQGIKNNTQGLRTQVQGV